MRSKTRVGGALAWLTASAFALTGCAATQEELAAVALACQEPVGIEVGIEMALNPALNPATSSPEMFTDKVGEHADALYKGCIYNGLLHHFGATVGDNFNVTSDVQKAGPVLSFNTVVEANGHRIELPTFNMAVMLIPGLPSGFPPPNPNGGVF